jgi:hypothetical protein
LTLPAPGVQRHRWRGEPSAPHVFQLKLSSSQFVAVTDRPMNRLTIGELAERAKVHIETLRYYPVKCQENGREFAGKTQICRCHIAHHPHRALQRAECQRARLSQAQQDDGKIAGIRQRSRRQNSGLVMPFLVRWWPRRLGRGGRACPARGRRAVGDDRPT